MGRNGKSLMGIPWEWELVTKLGMGMGRNGNRLHGNGREWECKKPFPEWTRTSLLQSVSQGSVTHARRAGRKSVARRLWRPIMKPRRLRRRRRLL